MVKTWTTTVVMGWKVEGVVGENWWVNWSDVQDERKQVNLAAHTIMTWHVLSYLEHGSPVSQSTLLCLMFFSDHCSISRLLPHVSPTGLPSASFSLTPVWSPQNLPPILPCVTEDTVSGLSWEWMWTPGLLQKYLRPWVWVLKPKY